MIEKCGGAIAATSANRSGEADALDAAQAAHYLGDFVNVYIDGGQTPATKPSTVVDCSGDSPRVLREGDITSLQIEAVIQRS
jgi:tRNA A37 threonylcarbamoyladenosine synthetase subunit TsaC/SUA5/YrdC